MLPETGLWRKISVAKPDNYTEVLQQFYQATGFIAMMDHSFIADHSPVTLCWCRDKHYAAGKYLQADLSFRAVFYPAKFKITFEDRADTPLASLNLENTKYSHVLVWLEEHCRVLGLDTSTFSPDLPFEPVFESVITGKKSFGPDKEVLEMLVANFDNAYHALGSVSREIEGFSTILLYPKQLNLETSHVIKDTGDSETSACVRIGMCPGDDIRDEPYFYVNVLPFPSTKDFPQLPYGDWYEDQWVGAIYPFSSISLLSSGEEQFASVRSFLISGYELLKNTIR